MSAWHHVLLLISCLIFFGASQTYCIRGRYGTDQFINGEWIYAGSYNYGSGSAPYYSKTIVGDSPCGYIGTWYLYFDGSKWAVSDTSGGSSWAAYCSTSNDTNPSACTTDWRIYDSGLPSFVADSTVYIQVDGCSTWNSNGIEVSGSSNSSMCDGTFLPVSGTPNAFQKSGYYIFYLEYAHTWYCSQYLEPNTCPLTTPILGESLEMNPWVDLDPSDAPYDLGDSLGKVNCLPFTTDQPTKQPTTEPPTKSPADTAHPSKDPTGFPSSAPSLIPTKNPTLIPSLPPTNVPTSTPIGYLSRNPTTVNTPASTDPPTLLISTHPTAPSSVPEISAFV